VARFFGLKPKKTGEYLMAEEFLSDSTGSARPNSEPEKPEREPLRFMIIGSREGVKEQILKFYAMEFAQINEWSPLQRTQRKGEVMTILTRYRKKSRQSFLL
jgi:hypothetical protein